MPTYAIGDIQGCYIELTQLLDKIQFQPDSDRLWLVGDLVNRGPDSLRVLRLLKSLGQSITCVLGNHDLHLLAVDTGHASVNPGDTLNEILQAKDRRELLDWLRKQHLIYTEDQYILVHAGLLPQWDAQQAVSLAQEVENALHSENHHLFFAEMYGNKPNNWNDELQGNERLRVIINAMTRMRVCNKQGDMNYKFKGLYQDIPDKHYAWFDLPHRQTRQKTIIFGHWSALGLIVKPELIALDTGCLWGGALTAVRLEDRKVFQVSCASQPDHKIK